MQTMKYQCLACDTGFLEEEGQYRNGWLCCPSCWNPDLQEVRRENEELYKEAGRLVAKSYGEGFIKRADSFIEESVESPIGVVEE